MRAVLVMGLGEHLVRFCASVLTSHKDLAKAGRQFPMVQPENRRLNLGHRWFSNK